MEDSDSENYDEYNYFEDENDSDNDFDVKAERKAFERVSYEHPLLAGLSGVDKKKIIKDLSDQEKFAMNVNIYLVRYKSYFSDEDIRFILDTIYKIDAPKYLNPFAYVLGYYITQGTKKIIDNNLKDSFNIIKGETSISDIDIIRYARYWMINLL